MSTVVAGAGTGRPRWVRPTVFGVVIAIVAVAIGLWVWRANRTGTHFTADFTQTVGIYPGSGVRVLGVEVGTVDKVSPQGTTVKVSMHLNPGVHVSSKITAVIISPNLVSDRYIQLVGAYQAGPQLQGGTTLSTASTATPVEIDELYKNLTTLAQQLGPNGANKDGALSRLIDTGAQVLKGNGQSIHDTIDSVAQALSTLSGSKDDIFATVKNLDTFTQTLKNNNDNVIDVDNKLASLSTVLANDRQSFADALKELGSALADVQGFIHDNQDAITSDVGKLQQVAQVLADQRAGLAKALQASPLLVQNFLNAYDPKNHLLVGRINLNELTIWAKQNASTSSAQEHSVTVGSNDDVPTLLPDGSGVTPAAGGAR